MTDAYLCDAIRTPIGRYAGALAPVRADDLAAVPLAALMARNASVDWAAVDDVIFGRASQAGETELMIAGGVESMSRAPFVMGKAETAFSRSADLASRIRWASPAAKKKYDAGQGEAADRRPFPGPPP